MLQTLAVFEEEDATACGLFRKLQSLDKAVQVLSEGRCQLFTGEVPDRSCKGRAGRGLWQKNPLHQLQPDLDSFVNISQEIKANKSTEVRLETLLQSYTNSLSSSLDARFSGCLAVVGAFSLFDPSAIPRKSNEEEFLHYGKEMVATLGEHYCPMEEPNMFGVSPTLFKDKLQAEWAQLKYYMCDIKSQIPLSMPPTEWFLKQFLRRKPSLISLFPIMLMIGEIAFTLPLSSVWPDRGASQLKLIKTAHRSRLSNNMLHALMQVTINGPPVSQCRDVVNRAVKSWLNEPRRKLPYKKSVATPQESTPVSHTVSVRDIDVQTEDVEKRIQTEVYLRAP